VWGKPSFHSFLSILFHNLCSKFPLPLSNCEDGVSCYSHILFLLQEAHPLNTVVIFQKIPVIQAFSKCHDNVWCSQVIAYYYCYYYYYHHLYYYHHHYCYCRTRVNWKSLSNTMLCHLMWIFLCLEVQIPSILIMSWVSWASSVNLYPWLLPFTELQTCGMIWQELYSTRRLWIETVIRGGIWGWQVGRLPQAPLLRGPCASGLRSPFWVCQAIFSGKLEMLIHAPFKIILQGQIT